MNRHGTSRRRYWCALVLFFLFVGRAAFADEGGPIVLRLSPDAPAPETPAEAIIESFIVNVRGAYISWFINGEKVGEGTGMTNYRFVTPGVGERVAIEALILTEDGKTFKETLAFRPSTVDILWQADSYVPPFYRGKALPTHRSKITAVAVPNFPGVDPKKVTYKWTLDRSTLVGVGYGMMQTSVLANWEGSPTALGVEAKSQDGTYRANHRVAPRSVKPEIRYYEDAPLYGPRYARALSGAEKSAAPEYTLRAVPFFFSKSSRRLGDLVYEWYINNQPVQFERGDTEKVTILRGSDGASRVSHSVLLKIYNKKAVTQTAAAGVTIAFEDSGARPVFGEE